MRRVVVTGLGLVTPLGVGVDHNWRGITSGKSGIGAIQAFDVSDLPAKIAGDVSAFTSRLPSALSAIGIILAFYFFLRMFWKKQIAFFSSLILITNYTFLEQARLAIIDMALTLFMFLALLSFIKGYMEESRRKTYYSLFSVFCGLAMLSKGPIGVIVPCGIVFLFLI